MNENIVKEVFSVYEVLKDSMKVTRRSINKEAFFLHNRTIFLGEKRDQMLVKLANTEEELDDIMILSLFATFERELRASIDNLIVTNTSKLNKTIEKLTLLTTNSIERWAIYDIVVAFSDVADEALRGKIKQIYEYRNWVAHGKNQNRTPSIRTDPKTAQIALVDFILCAKHAMSFSENQAR